MRKFLLISGCLFLSLTTLTPVPSLAANTPEIAKVFIETHENNGYYGDAIRIVFSKPMALQSQTDPRISHQAGVNTPQAPAGYSENGGASAKNAARNYIITITPEQGSNTSPYTGTWADLGGIAVYDTYDPQKTTVLLLPPSTTTNLFQPGDIVEVSLALTVQDSEGVTLNSEKSKYTSRSS